MKTYHVGGFNPINRFKTLKEALESKKVQDDDTIVIHKNLNETVKVTKNVIIQGNGHTFSVEQGKAGIKTVSPCEIHNLKFSVQPRANAILAQNDILLDKIEVSLNGPIRAFYPLVLVQGAHKAVISSSKLMLLSLDGPTRSEITDTEFLDYYPGNVMLSTRDNMSVIYGDTMIDNCRLHSIRLSGNATVKDSQLDRFVDIDGLKNVKVQTTLTDCVIDTTIQQVKKNAFKKEPKSGPLKNRMDNKYVLALRPDSNVRISNLQIQQTQDGFMGIFGEDTNLIYQNTNLSDQGIKNRLVDSNLSLKKTNDQNFWQLDGKTSAAYVRSKLNASMEYETAMEKLDKMIGQQGVKDKIHSIMNTINQQNATDNKDFSFSYHMIFAGDPGTGKSTIGHIVSQALYEIGAIPENKFTFVDSSDIVQGYIGQTGQKMREILDKAIGGVLFIDEAYQLTVKNGEKSFNSEAITPLVQYMDAHRTDLVVIAAGYNKEMKEFMASNVGFTRRFQWIQFENYTSNELAEIFDSMRESYGDKYADPKLDKLIAPLFHKVTQTYLSIPDANGRVTNGGNGGLARNIYQDIATARNNRIAKTSDHNQALEQQDILIGFKQQLIKANNLKL